MDTNTQSPSVANDLKSSHENTSGSDLNRVSLPRENTSAQATPTVADPPSASAYSRSPTTKKILVADDNLIIRKTVATALSKAGYQVSVAGDIPEALSAARREMPDVMLLDISFPVDPANVGGPSQDGTFVIQWLQRTPETAKIPIIIITGTDPVKYKDQISSQGIIACFRKPLNHDELLTTIRAALANKSA